MDKFTAVQKLGKVWLLFTINQVYVFGSKKEVEAYCKRMRLSEKSNPKESRDE